MKKLLSIFSSVILALLITTSGIINGFAVGIPENDLFQTLDFSTNGEATEEPAISDYPEITGFENTANGTKVSWREYSGAKSYLLYVLNGTEWKQLGKSATLSYTHTSLRNGTTYTYTVRALDANNNFIGSYCTQGYENTFYAPPKISSIKKKNNGNLIRWENVSGVSGYRLYRKTFGKSWATLADITSDNFYVDTSAKDNNIYSYTLRCADENGKFISYYILKTKYYYNGRIANGVITVGKNKYGFKNGTLKTGFQKINGNKYYFNSSGILQKNCIVGSKKTGWYYVGKKGIIDPEYRNGITYKGKDWNVMKGKATKVSTKSDRTLFRALKIVAKITNKSMSKPTKLKVCYNYVKNSYTELNPRIPHYTGNDWPILYANDMFVDGAGNCFSYAAAFAYMAKAIGYKNVYCCNSGGHGWAEINGLIYDPEWSRHHSREYYALSYETTKDPNYKGAIAPGYSWMHKKI